MHLWSGLNWSPAQVVFLAGGVINPRVVDMQSRHQALSSSKKPKASPSIFLTSQMENLYLLNSHSVITKFRSVV